MYGIDRTLRAMLMSINLCVYQMYDDDDDDGQEACFKAPHSGGIRTPEPNKETIEIGIVRLGHVVKVKLTCFRFYH